MYFQYPHNKLRLVEVACIVDWLLHLGWDEVMGRLGDWKIVGVASKTIAGRHGKIKPAQIQVVFCG